jgi:hypothetical protein
MIKITKMPEYSFLGGSKSTNLATRNLAERIHHRSAKLFYITIVEGKKFTFTVKP